MGMVWMDKFKSAFLTSGERSLRLGQSLVEYILLLGAVATFVAVVFNSAAFKRVIGPNSEIFAKMRGYMEYSYRHASPGNELRSDYFGKKHDTYYNSKKQATHFFGPAAKYP
jgi:hypothetical protein